MAISGNARARGSWVNSNSAPFRGETLVSNVSRERGDGGAGFRGKSSQASVTATNLKKRSETSRSEETTSGHSRAIEQGSPGGLGNTWSSYAQVIGCINTYQNGITLSLHEGVRTSKKSGEGRADVAVKRYLPNQFHLRLKDTRDYQLPDGKYFLYKKEVLAALERHLSNLNQKGLLKGAVFYFGTVTDPFLSFHKKFDITTGCLELFEKYRPGKLVVQTRSPMVIAALPCFRLLGEDAVAGIPIETHLEKSVARYTPGMPKISERLVAAQGLRRQGVKVNAIVSPVLPYGDFERDAWDFAELLDRHADYITLGCLATGNEADERQLRELPIAHRIEADRHFAWLRPHAYKPVLEALEVIAPEKLRLPVRAMEKSGQLALFAA